MKKKFDISMRPQIESGEYKVVTADDHPVRICCWDAEEDYPIVALVKDYNEKSDYCYPMMCDTAGVSATKGKQKQLYVLTPEPELTDFEKGVLRCIEDYDPEIMSADEMCEEARKEAQKLLAIARKDQQPKYDATKVDEALIDGMMIIWRKRKLDNDVSFDCHEVEAYRQGLTDMYRQFAAELNEAFNQVVYNQGYEKVFKQLFNSIPHWENSSVSKCSQPTITSQNVLFYKGYFIHIDELFEKLPKDEQDNY